MINEHKYEAVVIGTSAGGVEIIKYLITNLPEHYLLPIIIVQHIGNTSGNTWIELLDQKAKIKVKEADEKELIQPGIVYLAPPDYHLLIESDHTFTLTVDERVNYARPSIDVLFETAAEAYREKLIGIICTGGNSDGAKGLLRIKELGGLTIVQSPETAEVRTMPEAAIETALPDQILTPKEIVILLLDIYRKNEKNELQD